jgi:hypothetical protein
MSKDIQHSGKFDNPMKDMNYFRLWQRLLDTSSDSTESSLPNLAPLTNDGIDDSWRGLWRMLLTEFLPYAETVLSGIESVDNRAHIRFYEPPKNPKRWQKSIDDETMEDDEKADLENHGGAQYKFLSDVYGWGLNVTLKYIEHRWERYLRLSPALGFGTLQDSWPTPFFVPRSQVLCRFLVERLESFARARRTYHVIIEGRIRKPKHAREVKRGTIDDVIGDQVGRPRNIDCSPLDIQNLWLVLIWPIAVHNRWSYKEVVRVLRLTFRTDRMGRLAKGRTLRELGDAASDGAGTIEEMYEEELELRKESEKDLLRVSGDDRRKMRLRCERLGLEKLNPHRDSGRLPKDFELAKAISTQI